jgi:predicted SprT family Zn-dependent metalloprotease
MVFKHGIWLEDVKEQKFLLSTSNKQYHPNKYHKICNDILSVTEETPKEAIDAVHVQIPELMETTNLTLNAIRFKTEMPNYGQLGGAYGDSFILLSNNITKNKLLKTQKIDKDKIDEFIIEYNAELHFIENSTQQSNIKRKEELIYNIGWCEDKLQYDNFTYEGDNRNQIIDHEFYHCLSYARGGYTKHGLLFSQDMLCRTFCRDTKISFYGADSYIGEPSAEVYAYWKDGNKIPRKLEHNFRRIEDGKM